MYKRIIYIIQFNFKLLRISKTPFICKKEQKSIISAKIINNTIIKILFLNPEIPPNHNNTQFGLLDPISMHYYDTCGALLTFS